MSDSEDEYGMYSRAEGKETNLDVINVGNVDSDCSTISASEVASNNYNPPTPPLFCKLKRVRVLIKKLPRNVLAKYNFVCPKSSLRSSGRIKSKNIQIGQYLSLHKNKPLNEVVVKQKRLRTSPVKIVENERRTKQRNLPLNKKSNLKPNNNVTGALGTTNVVGKTVRSSDYSSAPRKLYFSFGATSNNNAYKNKATSVGNTQTYSNLANTSSPINNRTLHERMASTRTINKPVSTTLPNFPDVIITRYDIQPTSRNNLMLDESHVEKILPTTDCNSLENSKIYSRRSGTTQTYTSNTQQQPDVFPTFITSASVAKKNHFHSKVSNVTSTASNVGLHRLSHSTPRKFTVQAFKIPNDFPKADTSVTVDSPKVFVINKPSLVNNTSNMSNSMGTSKKNQESQVAKTSDINSNMGICVESDSDVELIDTEKQTEPEVIKRIIYHTKAVQTRFTCNSSICGLIDSDEFNLNCFYCYDIFPLHKWFEFKEHIKRVHQVEEKANLSDEKTDDAHSRRPQIHTHKNVNVTKTMNTTSKPINKKDVIPTTKATSTTEMINKKLPLELKLVQKETITEPTKLVSSTSKTPLKNLKHIDIFGESKTPSKGKLPNEKFNKKDIEETINLDSDDCELDIGDLDDASKNAMKPMQAGKKSAYNKQCLSNTVSQINDVKLVLPTLPHITIKKLGRTLPKEQVNVPTPALESQTFKENFIKIPSNTNIQKVIKTLPKPTAEQLSTNGRTRPRYFVVKKIIKLPTKDVVSDINIPKGTILKKVQSGSEISKTKKVVYGNAILTEKIEDSVPKPTSGLGILFGVTNSMVVIEFLLKLKSFPELWRCSVDNTDTVAYSESIEKLCFHLNSRFDLNIAESELRLSIQRVKEWYYLMLKSIEEHKSSSNNTEPYKHRFPIYFRILNQFLSPNVSDEKKLFNSQIKSNTTGNNAIGYRTAPLPPKADANRLAEKVTEADEAKSKSCIRIFKTPQHITSPSNMQSNAPTNLENLLTPEMATENLIEFDADTLYDQESSDEEVLEEFDETNFFNKKINKKITKAGGQQKRRTKIYLGKFECDKCRKIFKRSCDLKRHRILHFPPEFECDSCSQKFYYKHWAERCTHVRNNNHSRYKRVDKTSDEKRIWPKKIFRFLLICEICGASYRSIGSLNTHKRDKHLNQRNRCVVCKFTALSNWRIMQHQRKRHIVEPGTVEDVAKKSRARTDTKTPFSNEARQAFDWRREMRAKLKPGEIFYGCGKCRIVFKSRKEKVLHNKIEHPITEFTVICLLCLPNKLLLSNSNCARRHYTDIHKVPWHEIDRLVKRTKPIFNLLSKEEIEMLKASENYKELLDELLKDKTLQSVDSVQSLEDETSKAVQNLPALSNIKELDEDVKKIEAEEFIQEENVYVDGIIDHDYNSENDFKELYCTNIIEHNYSEEQETTENVDDFVVAVDKQEENELYSQQSSEEGIAHLISDVASNENKMQTYVQNDQEYVKNIVEEFVDGELVEESIVVEEYIDEVIGEEEEYF